MKSISRRILWAFAPVLAILLVVSWVSHRNSERLLENAALVAHTREVIAQVEATVALVKDAQIAVRDFTITHLESSADRLATAGRNSEEAVENLRGLTADNPLQQANVAALAKVLEDAQATLNTEIRSSRESPDRVAARLHEAALTGKGLAAVFEALAKIREEEERLLREREAAAASSATTADFTLLASALAAVAVILLSGQRLANSIVRPASELGRAAEAVGGGDLSRRVQVTTQDELGLLGTAFNSMISRLQEANTAQTNREWIKTHVVALARLTQGRRDPAGVTSDVLAQLAPITGAAVGAFHLVDRSSGAVHISCASGYALQAGGVTTGVDAARSNAGGGGSAADSAHSLVGQAVRDKRRILLSNVPEDYLRVSSGLGSAAPRQVVILPLLFDGEAGGVIELGSFEPFPPRVLELLDEVSGGLGSVLAALVASARTDELLKKTQEFSHELQAQQEELRASNETLDTKNRLLVASEEELRQAEEEQRVLNEELQEKARLLQDQNAEIARKHQEVEQSRTDLQAKAEELDRASRYKSEFLSNMSHELRTPLNSLLLLSRMLAENADGNLSARQVEFARTIHHSGQDLLELINDILDLAKIESGTVTVEQDSVPLARIAQFAETTFRPLAESKKLGFTVKLDPELPPSIATDERRLNQVLKNFLSNALKFTEGGAVSLEIAPAHGGWHAGSPELEHAARVVAFHVRDSGIGIAKDKLELIFEAFQQADGTTSRRFGGTGLGLSISRGLANLLGGAIGVQSEPGHGSVFTFYLPADRSSAPRPAQKASPAAASTPPANRPAPGIAPSAAFAPQVDESAAKTTPASPPTTSSATAGDDSGTAPPVALPGDIADDRSAIRRGDDVILIVEDDHAFARILAEIARDQGFKVVVASTAEHGLQLARHYQPAAVTLDLRLPDGDGWVVLDRLKHDASTAHIPVHVISSTENDQSATRRGAVTFLQKPVSAEQLTKAMTEIGDSVRRSVRRLLLVDDDSTTREVIAQMLRSPDVEIVSAACAEDGLAALRSQHFDCVVLDFTLPTASGMQMLEAMRANEATAPTPVVVYTGRDLSREETERLERLSEAIVLKGPRSQERLLDETALFLHRVQSRRPEARRRMVERVRASDPLLAGKQVLLVDDDMRNIFSLTAVLERHKMVVKYAQSGGDALSTLERGPAPDVVLMDIMMPGMDGFEAMRRIRKNSAWKELPIIAVTAKAMRGDREKCLEAGANDYIAKPVEVEQLLSLLRVWLFR